MTRILNPGILPGLSATAKGAAPATGTPAGKFLRDDGTWQTVAGGSTPTGTGWRHVTDGTEDAAASTPSASDVGAEVSGAVTSHNGLTTVHAAATTIGGKAIPSAGFEPAGTGHTEATDHVSAHASLTTGIHGLGAMSQIADAPSNGSTYGRKDGAWAVAGGSGLTSAETFARVTVRL